MQWVVILRIGDNDTQLSAGCSDERMAPSIQNELALKAEHLNNTDVIFENSEAVNKADAMIRQILMEDLPAANGAYMDFDCLRDRQESIYQKMHEEQFKIVMRELSADF